MTASLPNSADYGVSQPCNIKPQVVPGTLWDMIEKSEKSEYFRNIIIKALMFDDFNDPSLNKTILLPINLTEQLPYTESKVLNTFTINTVLHLNGGGNFKVQNNLKEYISFSCGPNVTYILALDIVWKVTVFNIRCINGIIHIIEPVDCAEQS